MLLWQPHQVETVMLKELTLASNECCPRQSILLAFHGVATLLLAFCSSLARLLGCVFRSSLTPLPHLPSRYFVIARSCNVSWLFIDVRLRSLHDCSEPSRPSTILITPRTTGGLGYRSAGYCTCKMEQARCSISGVQKSQVELEYVNFGST